MTATPEVLASLLAITPRDRWPSQRCVAWVERGERNCGKHAIDHLCTMHQAVATRKWERMVIEKEQELADYRAKRELRRAAAIVERDKVQARIDRLDPPDDTDLAAVTGAVHRRIERRKMQRLNDRKVSELARLTERLAWLDQQIGDQP